MPAPPARNRSARVPCGVELHLELTREILCREESVLPHVRGQHLAYLTGLQQQAQTLAVDAHVVGDDGEVLHAAVADGIDQVDRNAAQPEPTDGDQLPIAEHLPQCLRSTFADLRPGGLGACPPGSEHSPGACDGGMLAW